MRKFSKKLLLFVSGILGVIALCLCFFHSYSYPDSLFKIDKQKNILILGDSQTECAVDDKILPNSINLSQGADHHLYTYAKLKKILSCNNSIDTVIIGHSYNNMLKDYETYYYQTDKIFQYKLPKYYSILSFSELAELSKINTKSMTVSVPAIVKYNLGLFLKKNCSFEDLDLGKFIAIDNKEKKFVNYTRINNDEVSLIQQKYLNLIQKLCSEKKIQLILLSTPNRFSKEVYPEAYRRKFNNKNYKNTVHLNCTDIILDESCFYDLVHLNKRGSELFTVYLRDSVLHNHD